MLIVVIVLCIIFLLAAFGSSGNSYICHDITPKFKTGDIVASKIDGKKFLLTGVNYIRCPYNACCGGGDHEDGWAARDSSGNNAVLFEEEIELL